MSKQKTENTVVKQLIKRALKDVERASSQLDSEDVEKLVRIRNIIALLKKMESSLR